MSDELSNRISKLEAHRENDSKFLERLEEKFEKGIESISNTLNLRFDQLMKSSDGIRNLAQTALDTASNADVRSSRNEEKVHTLFQRVEDIETRELVSESKKKGAFMLFYFIKDNWHFLVTISVVIAATQV